MVSPMTNEAGQSRTSIRRAGNSAAAIYDRVRSDILAGRLQPGMPLSQLGLAKAHGTSRGPVREALHRLQQDELVTGEANKRYNVAAFAVADLESALALHLVNVTLAIRVSVPLLTEPNLLAVDAAVDRMAAALDHDTAAWEAAYRSFALAICGQAGGKVCALIGTLIDTIQRFRVNLLDRLPRVYAEAEDFRQIAAAARAGDGEFSATLFAAFFGRISSLIIAGAAPRYDSARLRGYLNAVAPEVG